MKIAYCCADPGVPAFGRKGASVHVQSVLRALVDRGEQVELVATRLDGPPPPALERVAVTRLPPLRGAGAGARERAALDANASVARILAASEPDLVYERYSLWSFAGMEYARDAAVPGVLEVNAPLLEEQATHRSLVDPEAAARASARAFAAAQLIVAVSHAVARWLESWPGTAGKVHVVPNGVDPRRFPAPASPPPGRPFTVGFVGTLKPWHGLDVLVEGFARLRDAVPTAELLVVGDGPCRAELESDLVARGLAGAASFAGSVAPDEVAAWLTRMDAAVAPYPSMDGFYFSPLKVVEYMAAAVPVVASAVGELPELLDGAGLICTPGDGEELASALVALAADPHLRRRLGERGRKRVLSTRTWDAIVARILELAGAPVRAEVVPA